MSNAPAFDLEALPVEQAAQELRRLAAWSLREMAVQGEQPMPDLTLWHQWIGPKAERLWHHKRPNAPQKRLRKQVRWTERRAQQALCSGDAPIPDFFLALAASIGWAHPDFEIEAWRYTRRRLEQSTIFTPDLEAHLGFATATFWILIAIALDRQPARKRPPRWYAPHSWRRYRQARTMNRLGKMCIRLASQRRRWAGFWDQWLIAEALLSLDLEQRESWLECPLALASMPVIRIRLGLPPAETEAADDAPINYRPDWTLNAPPALLKRYGYPIQPPPLPQQVARD